MYGTAEASGSTGTSFRNIHGSWTGRTRTTRRRYAGPSSSAPPRGPPPRALAMRRRLAAPPSPAPHSRCPRRRSNQMHHGAAVRRPCRQRRAPPRARRRAGEAGRCDFGIFDSGPRGNRARRRRGWSARHRVCSRGPRTSAAPLRRSRRTPQSLSGVYRAVVPSARPSVEGRRVRAVEHAARAGSRSSCQRT